MRINYLKEITHLKEYMFVKDNQFDGAQYIDVRYYEASKDLDETTQAIINDKLRAMSANFNNRVQQLQQSNDIYY